MTSKSVSTSGSESSRASSLYGLDEHSTKPIVVYKFRSGEKRLELTTERDLCAKLDNPASIRRPDPLLRYIHVTKKPIPRGSSRLEILTEDLLPPSVREKYADKPIKASRANVGLPTLAKWKHLLKRSSYDTLYIVSHSHYPWPDASKNNTPESSQLVSPAVTFPNEALHHQDA